MLIFTIIVTVSLLFLQPFKCIESVTNLQGHSLNSINPNHSDGYFSTEGSSLKYNQRRESVSVSVEQKEKIKNLVIKRYATQASVSTNPTDVIKMGDSRTQVNSYKQETADRSPYSVVVFVKTAEGRLSCTGTLLTLQWVLTAASCFKKAPLVEVIIYAGGNAHDEYLNNTLAQGSQVRSSSEHHSHPYYYRTGEYKSFFNVAVVKTDQVLKLSGTVAPIQLSTKHVSFAHPTDCKVTGFGRVDLLTTSTNYFRKTQLLSVETPCQCFDDKDSDYWICPQSDNRPFSLCLGDIGAGLICEGKVQGIMSGIVAVLDARSCDTRYPKYYDCLRHNNTINVFQGTCPHLKFINQYVKLFPKTQIPKDCDFQPQERKPSTETPRARANNGPYFAFINILFAIVLLCKLN